MQVERAFGQPGASGGRVRNTWVTYLSVRNTGEKSPTIPHGLSSSRRRAKSQDAGSWARGRLAGWWGKSLPRQRSVAGLRGRSATLGLRTAQTPTGGSSEEFSAMGASLTEQRRVQEEGFRIVNCFSWGRERTVPKESAPANYVPAAAVIRRGRALSGVTGRKAHAGGRVSLGLQLPAQLGERLEDCRT
jgi:hypothetical protein